MTKKKKKDLTAKEKEMLNLKYEIAREIGLEKKIKKRDGVVLPPGKQEK